MLVEMASLGEPAPDTSQALGKEYAAETDGTNEIVATSRGMIGDTAWIAVH